MAFNETSQKHTVSDGDGQCNYIEHSRCSAENNRQFVLCCCEYWIKRPHNVLSHHPLTCHSLILSRECHGIYLNNKSAASHVNPHSPLEIRYDDDLLAEESHSLSVSHAEPIHLRKGTATHSHLLNHRRRRRR